MITVNRVWGSKNPGILNDPFFREFDLLFRNALLNESHFEPFNNSLKVPYPLDSWFNDEYLVFEIPIINGKLEDVEITKTADQLRIKYVRSDKEQKEGRTYIKRNIIQRDFDFVWRITSKFDHTGIQSVFENSLLTIYIPFAKEAIPEKVQILDTGANWKKIATGEQLEEVPKQNGKSSKIPVLREDA